jgi:hypothetical protein
MYLRCYPFDVGQMSSHQGALLDHAEQLGLPMPALFMDNGIRSRDPRPALGRLMVLAEEQAVTVLLIPGIFVFSLHDQTALAIASRFTGTGCRIVELCSPRKAGRPGRFTDATLRAKSDPGKSSG